MKDRIIRVSVGLTYEIYYWVKFFIPIKNGKPKHDINNNIVVSLTSYGKRLAWIAPCLESLLSQSLTPECVILWLYKNDQAPKNIIKLTKRGLKICYVDEDLGPYKKYIYAKRKYPDKIIVTADDDVTYGKYWLENLYQFYIKLPRSLPFYRGYKIGFMQNHSNKPILASYRNWETLKPLEEKSGFHLLPVGVGGILYGLDYSHKDLLNDKVFMNLAPNCDDLWFKAIGTMAGFTPLKIKSTRKGLLKFIWNYPYQHMYLSKLLRYYEKPLYYENIYKNKNDLVMNKIVERYPSVLESIWFDYQSDRKYKKEA